MTNNYNITNTNKKAVVGGNPSHLDIVSLEGGDKALVITEENQKPKKVADTNAGTFNNKTATVDISNTTAGIKIIHASRAEDAPLLVMS